MSGEPQLERSVLEGKEREKLQAIAEALGLKPTARAKKADLIDGILRATGVEVPAVAVADGVKPKRTVRKRATEAPSDPVGGGNGGVATLAFPADGADGADPAIEAEGGAPVEEAGVGPGGPSQPSGVARGADPVDGPDGSVLAGSAAGEPADPQVEGGSARSGGATEPAGAEPPSSTADAVSEDHDASRNGGERPPSGPPASPSRPQAARPAAPPGPPGPGNHATPPAGQQQPQGHGQGNQSMPSQPAPGGPQQPAPGQQGQPAEGDVRRNRRRRGRDRDRVGPGYDQQAQHADQAYSGDPLPCDGLLEVRPEGFGFLRTSGYLQGPDDVYVSTSQVRKFALRPGDRIVGASRPATTQERFGALLRIDAVGDKSPEEARRRRRFEDLTPVVPDERLTLELVDPDDPANTTARIIDLLSPIGKGQRGLIVSPPKAGKTTVIKHLAKAIAANHPDVDLMVLLVDERPEEVTDVRRSVDGEVIGSTFDRPPEEHAQVAGLAIEVAKRRVELGRDVVLLVDGVTRLARACNLASPGTGRVLAGGVDAGALQAPLRLLGAARKAEEGGSLTILATAEVETGSVTDSVIFEQLTGTANMDLRLDGDLAERRLYPSIDVTRSSTQQEGLLLTKDELHLVWQLRRALVAHGQHGSGQKGHQVLLGLLRRNTTNADLLADLARSPDEVAGTAEDPLRLEGSL